MTPFLLGITLLFSEKINKLLGLGFCWLLVHLGKEKKSLTVEINDDDRSATGGIFGAAEVMSLCGFWGGFFRALAAETERLRRRFTFYFFNSLCILMFLQNNSLFSEITL